MMGPYPAYKDSGIEWIGEIPEHWEVKKLKYLVWLINEKTDDVDQYKLRIALENIEGFTGKLINGCSSFEGTGNIFKKGDVLFNKLRPYLCKVVLTPEDGVSVGELLTFRSTEYINNKFLFYRLLSKDFISVVNGSTYGSKMPRASWEFIGNLNITFPPISDQSQIADFLNHKTQQIDILIEKKQKQIELLKEQRTAVINQVVTKGLYPNVKMKDSGIEWLGEIPEHWDVAKFKYLCSLLRDGTHQPPQRHDEGVPLLSVRNIVNGIFVNLPDDSLISSEDYLKLIKSFEIVENDVLLAIVGATLGKVAIVEKMAPFFIQRSLAVFRPINTKLHFKYLFYYLQSSSFQKLMWRNVGYSAQPGIYLNTLCNFYCTLPSIQEQKQIVDFLDNKCSMFERSMQKISRTINLLKEYRTTLISEAVTGKIDVREWQGNKT